MPYAPGIQDISGQLIAQGATDRARAIAQGVGSASSSLAQGIMAYAQKQEENKVALGKAKSTETFIKAHPDLFGGDDVVKQLTATDPNETPMQKYNRLAQSVQDAVVGEKMQMEQSQLAAQKFAQDEAQKKKAEEDAQKAKLQQFMQFSQGGGRGVYSPAAQSAMSSQLYGTTNPDDVPAMEPGQLPPGANPQLRQTLDFFAAQGRLPTAGENSTMIADTGRQQVAETRTAAEQAVAGARAEARTAIEEAKRQIDQQKLDAKNASNVTFSTAPNGEIMAYANGQLTHVPNGAPKHPVLAAIEKDEKAGKISPEWAQYFRTKVYERAGEFSPNSGAAFGDAMQRTANGGGAQQSPQAQPSAIPRPTVPLYAPPAATPVHAQPPAQTRPVTSTYPRVRDRNDPIYQKLSPGSPYVGPDGLIGIKPAVGP